MTQTSPFRAIADPVRREILDILRVSGRQRAGAIAERFPKITRIAVSKHLRVLRQAELVRVVESQDARERLYDLDPAGLREVSEWLRLYDAYWREHLEKLKRLVEAQESRDTEI